MNDNETQLSKWQKFRRTIVWEYAQVIVVALILVFGFIRPFVVEAFKIPSGSMEDTLLIGDRILVCKFIYGITIPGTKYQGPRFSQTCARRRFRLYSTARSGNEISSNAS